jgi:hypothetical protein
MAAKTSAQRPAQSKGAGEGQGEPSRKKTVSAKLNALRRKTGKGKQRRRSRGQGPFSYTVPAAGAMIGLSRSAAYRAMHAGQIPAIEINGGWVVPKLLWDQRLGIKAPAATARETSKSKEEHAIA